MLYYVLLIPAVQKSESFVCIHISPLCISFPFRSPQCFRGGSVGKKCLLQCRRPEFDPRAGKIWREKWQSTPEFLLGKFNGQRILAGYSLWVHKTERLNLPGSAPSIECSSLLYIIVYIYQYQSPNSSPLSLPTPIHMSAAYIHVSTYFCTR